MASLQADVQTIHKAMKGLGTDVPAVISVLGRRTKQQLLELSAEYSKLHKHSLEEDMRGESALGGHFLELARGLISHPTQIRISTLKNATKGAGTRERALIDVLVSSLPFEIQEIGRSEPSVIAAVINDVAGDFKKIMNALLKGNRDWNPVVNDGEAQSCAELLYQAGEGRLGTDEKIFVDIIARKSPEFLARVNDYYKSGHKKHSLEHAIKSETSGYFEDTLLGLLKPRFVFIADRLFQAMKGLGTDDSCLVYYFSVLSKQEIQEVARVFYERRTVEDGDKAKTLQQWIDGDTSGAYRDLLRALLQPN